VLRERVNRRSPWTFVPTAYLLQGLPYFLVTEAAVVLYKRLGMPNDEVAWWTSLLAWPWALKLLWAPLVEVVGTRRIWLLSAQIALVFLTVAFAGSLASLRASLAVLAMIGFVSATHDVALDGYYLLALDADQQAFFSGVRSTTFKLARIVAAGLVVWIAGQLEGRAGVFAGLDQALAAAISDPTRRPWVFALIVAAAIQAGATAWDLALVRESGDDVARTPNVWALLSAATGLFRRPGIGWTLLFILTYRLPEQMITKMASPFLLDPRAQGGLAVSTSDVGLLTGALGVVCIVLGGLGGGFAIARWGLRRCLWPMLAMMHAPNLLYLAAAVAKPGLAGAAAVIATEQLGYGIGFSAYTVVILRVAQGTGSPTSSYAVATAIMAVGGFIAGASSGWLQVHLGYTQFFGLVSVLALPGLVPVWFVRRGL
jgi:PAT family beta-lactamase induction signal transducer AmpG